jgi:hypothetical protein
MLQSRTIATTLLVLAFTTAPLLAQKGDKPTKNTGQVKKGAENPKGKGFVKPTGNVKDKGAVKNKGVVKNAGNSKGKGVVKPTGKPQVSKAELVKKFDLDGDGKLNAEERKQAIAEFRKNQPQRSKALRAELIKKYDANGDGQLTGQEGLH